MPHIVRFNAKLPEKLAMWPHYTTYRAKHDYATIARFVGINGNNDDELVEALVQKIIKLSHDCGVTLSLKANGVDKADFDRKVDQLAVLAYEDQCTTTNPVEPLVSQLKTIFEDCYLGKNVEK